MTDYSGLIERLEAGSGRDTDLAYDICRALGYSSPPIPGRDYKGDVTGSLDAALAFAAAVNVPWRVVLFDALWRVDDDFARLPRAVLVHTLYHHALRAPAKDTTDAE